MNNRMWNMKRYKRLSFSLTANGKKVASKTYKNMYVGAKSYQAKKIVLRIDGKPNIDLRNSTCSLNVSYDPVWVYDSGREIVD